MSFSARKIFKAADQEIFAGASGDWNPMHLDPLAARRTQMGAPVVHGMHTALLGLDTFAEATKNIPLLSGITVNFLKPVYLDDLVVFSISRQNPLRLSAAVEGVAVMTMDLREHSREKPWPSQSGPTETASVNRSPRERSFAELEKSSGTTGKIALSNAPENLFPHASRWIGPGRVGALAALSRLVGMECPGLHSIFIGFTVDFILEGPADKVEFSVLSVDERFRRVKINVGGGGLQGTVDAALRTPPVLQPSLREIAAKIKPGQFSGQRVWVVGGSRGIGEYTAKVIAAGGGHLTVTYAVGKAEAEALLSEIKAFGGAAELMPYDVRLPSAAQLEKLKSPPTHVYYFATGRIFGRRGGGYNPALYQEFHRFYVEGFYDLCSALREKTENFSIFYPSSTAVTPEDRPKGMTEYAMAKAAGELLCADMKRLLPGVEVRVGRLPRLPTDQTATLMPGTKEESMDIFLPFILEMQGRP